MAWYQAQPGRPSLSKALVQEYRKALTAAQLAPSTINVRLSAIRKLAGEAADNRLLDLHFAAGIAQVKGAKNEGGRAGNWLTREQARELLQTCIGIRMQRAGLRNPPRQDGEDTIP